MMHSRIYLPSGELLSDVDLESLKGYVQDSRCVIWLDLDSPTTEEVDLVGLLLGITHLTLEDVTKQGQRAKIESYDRYLYMVMHGMRLEEPDGHLALPELDLILGLNYVLSVHYEPMDNVLQHRQITETTASVMSRGADFLLYALVDGLVDSYFPVLDSMDDLIDELEDIIVGRTEDGVLARIFRVKRDVVSLRKVISPQIEVFSQLTNRTYHQIKEEHIIYFRDVHDHLIRAFEVIDSYRDLMTGALDAYLSTVSNRLNSVMKRLTLIATIFMPITFVTGVFGMNFGYAPQVVWDNGTLFWFSLAGMAIITAVQLLYFRMQGWI
ncbi:MAG: magnesium/cobalt transporter CorA [Chloroflexota bacterium]|nr:MAG: magnesium/cobalt transporter CorA [Chloroflexota bacterium]